MSRNRSLRWCVSCGEPEAIHRRLSRAYGSGRRLLVIENVPVVSCRNCGESYLTSETLHEIERIKLHRRSLAKSRPVTTVSFG